MLPKVKKDFLGKEARREDVDLVTEQGHVEESADSKMMGSRCRKKITNCKLKEYVTEGTRMETSNGES